MTRRGRRRLLLLCVLMSLVLGMGVGGKLLLDWRRASAVQDARTQGLQAFEEGRYEDVVTTIGPYIRTLDSDLEVVLAVAKARQLVTLPDDGHIRGAIALYQRAADLDESNVEARLALIELLPRLGLLPELLSVADQVLELAPGNRRAVEARLGALGAMGRWDEVVSSSSQLIRESPTDLQWRRMQVSAGFAAGFDVEEMLELIDAWPVSDSTRATDDAIRGLLWLQMGDRAAADRLFERARDAGATSVESLQELTTILSDGRRVDLVQDLFDEFLNREGFDSEIAAIGADWGLRFGEREWLTAIIESSSMSDLDRAIMASRLAVFEVLTESDDLESTLDRIEAVADSAPSGVRMDFDILRRGVDVVRAESDREGKLGDLLIDIDPESRYQNEVAIAISARIGSRRLDEVIRSAGGASVSVLASLAEVQSLRNRGRPVESLERAMEVARAFPSRGEPIVVIGNLWAMTAGLPIELEIELAELTGFDSAFDLLSSVAREAGSESEVTLPLAEAAIRSGEWSEVGKIIDLVIASDRVDVDVMIRLHDLTANVDGAIAEKLRMAASDVASHDPRVIELNWRAGGPDRTIEALRDLLPLEDSDPLTRVRAWELLLRNSSDLDDDEFRELSERAFEINSGSRTIVLVLLGQSRCWDEPTFVRRLIDRLNEIDGESAELDILEGRWAIRQAEIDGDQVGEALARLDRRYVEGDRSLPVGMTMLSLMIVGEFDPLAIVRLGRQILGHHPDAYEVYPILISVMQDAQMYEAAEQLLATLEAADTGGLVAKRQRVVQSLRTGDFERLASTVSDIVAKTGTPIDGLRLALARKATGDLQSAEELLRRVLEASDPELADRALGLLVTILFELGRADEVEGVLQQCSGCVSRDVEEFYLTVARVQLGDVDAIDVLIQQTSSNPESEIGWVTAVNALVQAGRSEEAIQVALAGLRAHPSSFDLSRALLATGLSMPEEFDVIAAALDGSNPALQRSVQLLRDCLNGGRRLQPTARQLEVARSNTSRYPEDLLAWRSAVAIHEAAGRLGSARELASAAARQFPDLPEPAEWKVRLALASGNVPEALSDLRTWRALSFPDVRRVDETWAAMELSRGRGVEALRVLEPHRDAILAARDRFPGPYRALLASMLMSGRVRDAVNLEADRLSTDAVARETWAKLVSMAPYRAGVEAMSVLETMTPPDVVSRSILIGHWLGFHARHPAGAGLARARQLLPRVVSAPTDLESRVETLARAEVAIAEGAPEDSMALLQSVVDSYEPATIVALSDVPPEQRAEYIRSVEPFLIASNNLAMQLTERRIRFDDAEQLIRGCLKVVPGQPTVLDTYAQLLLAMGRPTEAEAAIVEAVRSGTTDPTIWATASEVLVALGRPDDARLLLQRARESLQLDPWPSVAIQSRLDAVTASIGGDE